MTSQTRDAMDRLIAVLKKEYKAVFIVTWDKRPPLERPIGEQGISLEVLCSETTDPRIVSEMFKELVRMVSEEGQADRVN